MLIYKQNSLTKQKEERWFYKHGSLMAIRFIYNVLMYKSLKVILEVRTINKSLVRSTAACCLVLTSNKIQVALQCNHITHNIPN